MSSTIFSHLLLFFALISKYYSTNLFAEQHRIYLFLFHFLYFLCRVWSSPNIIQHKKVWWLLQIYFIFIFEFSILVAFFKFSLFFCKFLDPDFLSIFGWFAFKFHLFAGYRAYHSGKQGGQKSKKWFFQILFFHFLFNSQYPN